MELPHWTHRHNGKLVDVVDIPTEAIGFIYIIRFTDNTYYIGKKLVRTREMKPALLNGKPRDNHIRFLSKIKKRKKVPYEELHKELNFASYIGSFDKSQYENNDVKSREILSFHSTKKGLSYHETKALFEYDVLMKDDFRNKNIGGTMFRKDIESVKYAEE